MFLDGQGWIFVGGGFGINRYRPGMLVLAGEIWRIFRLLAVGWEVRLPVSEITEEITKIGRAHV